MTNITNTLADFAVYRFFRRIDKQEKKLARNYSVTDPRDDQP